MKRLFASFRLKPAPTRQMQKIVNGVAEILLELSASSLPKPAPTRPVRQHTRVSRKMQSETFIGNDVSAFAREQNKHPYLFHGNNCKHLAYDFVRYIMQVEPDSFHTFCSSLEAVWKSQN